MIFDKTDIKRRSLIMIMSKERFFQAITELDSLIANLDYNIENLIIENQYDKVDEIQSIIDREQYINQFLNKDFPREDEYSAKDKNEQYFLSSSDNLDVLTIKLIKSYFQGLEFNSIRRQINFPTTKRAYIFTNNQDKKHLIKALEIKTDSNKQKIITYDKKKLFKTEKEKYKKFMQTLTKIHSEYQKKKLAGFKVLPDYKIQTKKQILDINYSTIIFETTTR